MAQLEAAGLQVDVVHSLSHSLSNHSLSNSELLSPTHPPPSYSTRITSLCSCVSASPQFHSIEHVADADLAHAPAPVLHAHRIVLLGLAVRVDHEIAEFAIRPDALRVRVPDERHDRTVQRDADVQRTEERRVGKEGR